MAGKRNVAAAKREGGEKGEIRSRPAVAVGGCGESWVGAERMVDALARERGVPSSCPLPFPLFLFANKMRYEL